MQYLLNEEEYKTLDEIEYYDNLLESIKNTATHIVKAVCILSPEIESNKYIVCNQDETYAPSVLAIILQHEDLKEANRICKKNSAINYKGR